ncbi:MAG: BMC domain-containing protein [Oscillospiraceae bacterium]|jgi:microcompartment protein CcmL/EutN|nr:BMC domain-containing protein [Oscillospiraceae bacterium]
METVGFLEFNSIAKGIEAADAVLKAAQVRLIFARASCPGKYYVLFTGEVAAAQASLEAGQAVGEGFVVDCCLIPRVHPQVTAAMQSVAGPAEVGALGVMEFFSVTAAIRAADAAVKAAQVQLAELRLATGIGGKSFALLTGEVAAVAEAVRCGVAAPESGGMTLAHVVIANPRPELWEQLY